MRKLAIALLLSSSAAMAAPDRVLTTLRPGTYTVTRDKSRANLSSKLVKRGDAQLTIHGDQVTLGEGHGVLTGTQVKLKPVVFDIKEHDGYKKTVVGYAGKAQVYDKATRAHTTVEVEMGRNPYAGYHAGLKDITVRSVTERGPAGPGYSTESNGAAFRIASEAK